MPLARAARQGFVALRAPVLRTPLPRRATKGPPRILREKIKWRIENMTKSRDKAVPSEIIGDLRALAAFSEPDAAATLKQAAATLEQAVDSLRLAIDHAQRVHWETIRRAHVHNSRIARDGGTYMSCGSLPPWFEKAQMALKTAMQP
jgi:hypothetical protein